MLTEAQKKWLEHLSDTDIVRVVPYNQKTEEVFAVMRDDLRKVLGDIGIYHRGSTAMKIAGQGEVDLYIPVLREDFDCCLDRLIEYLGKPGSLYPMKRSRFVKYVDGIKVEIFLVNKESNEWKDSVRFEEYLIKNLGALREYEKLKIDAGGQSVRAYYTVKVRFINDVLSRE